MEEYNKMAEENTTASRGNFYYGSSPVSSSVYGRTTTTPVPAGGLSQVQISNFHLQQPNESCYEQQSDGQVPVQVQVQVHPTVKTEAGGSSSLKFQYPSIIRSLHSFQDHHLQQQEEETGGSFGEVEAIKAKIIAHPQYSNILEAYMDCQKVGAPPEVVAKLTAVRKEFEAKQRASVAVAGRDARTKDPELDQFMEAYYDMLVKYSEQLTKTLQEATDFARKVEEQLNTLSIGSLKIMNPDEKCQVGVGSSEEEQDNSGGETELPEINPRAEDRELKNHLLKKYSGYLSSLKQELSKKKKKGKLPKDARQKLLSWWELHYKWPYPSESEKAGLAEATGLDQKQINNWFINQRKRHWKPSEDMQFLGMDAGGLHSQNAALYMEGHYMGTGPYRFCP